MAQAPNPMIPPHSSAVLRRFMGPAPLSRLFVERALLALTC